MYTPIEIFEMAKADHGSISLDGTDHEARMQLGVKIIRYTEDNKVEIYNTSKGGDYYSELTVDEVKLFTKKGWRIGIYVVALSNYCSKLDSLKEAIKNYSNNNLTKKQLQLLHNRRDSLLEKYNEVKNKLNQLK